MKRVFHWLDENLEEFLLVIGLIAMTLIMGIQVFCRYVLGMSLSWSEELTRYIFHLVRFFKRQLLQQKMPFHQDRAVCCDFSAERKSRFQNCESYI